MDQIIRLLTENPILALLLLGWLFSMIGGSITRAARKAEQQRRAAAPKAPPQQPAARRPEPRRAVQQSRSRPATPASAPAPRSQPSAEDIAAEIRRVMGLEEAPRPSAPRAAAKPKPKPRPAPDATPRSQFDHFAEGVGGLRSKVDPHVGEGVSTRDAPTSGAVGQRQLGSLGGTLARSPAPRARRIRRRGKRFDLSDPAAVLVTLEILGKPRALRDFEY